MHKKCLLQFIPLPLKVFLYSLIFFYLNNNRIVPIINPKVFQKEGSTPVPFTPLLRHTECFVQFSNSPTVCTPLYPSRYFMNRWNLVCIGPEILKWQSVFLNNLGRLNDFFGQKCLKLKLRSAFKPTWSWFVIKMYHCNDINGFPDFYNIRFDPKL